MVHAASALSAATAPNASQACSSVAGAMSGPAPRRGARPRRRLGAALRLALACAACSRATSSDPVEIDVAPLDGLTPKQRRKCDGDEEYARAHYERCCGKGRYIDRDAMCEKVKPWEDPDLRTPAWPKVKPRVDPKCMACARLVDNFDMAMLPRLRERHATTYYHHSSKYAKGNTLGELESIVEEEVETICQWPRTHHNMAVRKACYGIVEESSDDIVEVVSKWARKRLTGYVPDPDAHKLRIDGALPKPAEPVVEHWITGAEGRKQRRAEQRWLATGGAGGEAAKPPSLLAGGADADGGDGDGDDADGDDADGEGSDGERGGRRSAIVDPATLPPLTPDGAIALWGAGSRTGGGYTLPVDPALCDELRPQICVKLLKACSDYDLFELKEQDGEERSRLEHAALVGLEEGRPLESEPPMLVQTGQLTKVVAADFSKRVLEEGERTDYLIYFFFPGRWNETDDTHSKLRPTYLKLAQVLDPLGSNGSLAVGWMDCVFNQIPYPHGLHVHEDTIALYPAGAEHKAVPRYLQSLQGGRIELAELVDFVHGASTNVATHKHVAARRGEATERGIREGIQYPDFLDSLELDETKLLAENLTQVKENLRFADTLPPPKRKGRRRDDDDDDDDDDDEEYDDDDEYDDDYEDEIDYDESEYDDGYVAEDDEFRGGSAEEEAADAAEYYEHEDL